MPTVIYNPQTTSSAAAPAARAIGGAGPMQQAAPSDAFGVSAINPTAVAQGMNQLAQGLDRLNSRVEDFRLRAATTEAEEALVNFEREKNHQFFDPTEGYFNRQGRVAYDSAQSTVESLSKLKQKYADTLTSEEARAMFSKSADAQLTRAQQDVMRHASTQFNAWEAATLEARVENTLENASLYWNDPSQRSVQLEIGRQTLMDVGATQGLSPEAVAEKLQTYNSQFAMATIDAALNVSAAAGQQALMENKEMLEAPDLMKVQVAIDRRLVTEREQMLSDTAVNVAQDLVSQFGDLPSARRLITEQVNAIQDEDLRSRTLREATYQLDNRLRANSESQAATFELAEKFIVGGGSVDQFIAANPQGWETMTAAQQRKLRSGEIITTDWRTFSALLNLPQADLARVNPADYADKLSEPDRRALEQAVRAAITNDPAGQIGRTRSAEIESRITGLFGRETSTKKWDDETRSQVDAFYSTVTAEAMYREQLKGAPLSPQEFTSILDDLTRKKVVEGGSWFGFGSSEYTISDVPAVEYAPIASALRRLNRPVTGDNIVELYRQRETMRAAGTLPEAGQAGESASIYTNARGPLAGGYRQ